MPSCYQQYLPPKGRLNIMTKVFDQIQYHIPDKCNTLFDNIRCFLVSRNIKHLTEWLNIITKVVGFLIISTVSI